LKKGGVLRKRKTAGLHLLELSESFNENALESEKKGDRRRWPNRGDRSPCNPQLKKERKRETRILAGSHLDPNRTGVWQRMM